VITRWTRFRTDESGATAVEYGLIIGLISLALLGVLLTFDEQLLQHWRLIESEMQGLIDRST
jgi:pilus assembly protein Flp/PilA